METAMARNLDALLQGEWVAVAWTEFFDPEYPDAGDFEGRLRSRGDGTAVLSLPDLNGTLRIDLRRSTSSAMIGLFNGVARDGERISCPFDMVWSAASFRLLLQGDGDYRRITGVSITDMGLITTVASLDRNNALVARLAEWLDQAGPARLRLAPSMAGRRAQLEGEEPEHLLLRVRECEVALSVHDRHLSVDCEHCDDAPCAHALVAVASIAEQASRGKSTEEVRWLEKALLPPTPEILLGRVAGLLGSLGGESRAPTESTEGQWLSWFVEPAPGGLKVRPRMHRRLKSGAASAGSRPGAAQLEAILSRSELPQERAILALAKQLQRMSAASYYGRINASVADIIDRLSPLDALQALAGHPGIYCDGSPEPFAVQVGRPAVRVVTVDGQLRVLPGVTGVDQPGRELFPMPGGGVWLNRQKQTIHAVPYEDAHAAVFEGLLAIPPLPEELGGALAERLESVRGTLAVELPPELMGREVAAESAPRLIVAPEPGGARVSLAVRAAEGGSLVTPGAGEEVVRTTIGGERCWARRRLEDERTAAAALAVQLGWGADERARLLDTDDWFDLLERLDTPALAGVPVEWPADAVPMRVAVAPEVMRRVRITTAADWFGVEGEVEVDGAKVSLAALLAARKSRARYIEVRKNRFVRLSRLMTASLETLADLSHDERGRRVLSRSAAALAGDGRLTLDDEVTTPPAWSTLVDKARRAQSINVSPPSTLKAELRPYQAEGVAWMARLAELSLGGVLADDMGLGKTVQAIAALLRRRASGAALVLSPASVTFNWMRELERFAPSLRVHELRTADRAALLDSARAGDVVVASYGLLRHEIDAVAARDWGTLVLDEAQAIKNWNTETSKAVRRVPAGWRLALTGTPVENHLGELHALMQTVCPGVLGSWESFAREFATPIEQNGDADASARLSRLVRPLVLRRTKDQVLRELPDRIEVRRDVELGAAERALYEATRVAALEDLVGEDDDVPQDKRFRVLQQLTRLRQLACCSALVSPAAPRRSAKVRALIDDLSEVLEEGHTALVFSQFVSLLEVVSEELDEAGVEHLTLTGETSLAERRKRVDAFQAGKAKVFLISLKAGGTGLNLTAADYVFILDPWWNPAVEDQAADRAHRMGQTRPVTIVRLVALGTVEERVLSLHARKRALVASVLQEGDAAGRMDARDMVALLQEASAPAATDSAA